jgi:Kdo2-lipid IVA lauroyltransferase/acyltransferase
MTRFAIIFLSWLRFLPLPVLRALGAAFGYLLWAILGSRRRVVQTNLRLCFPELNDRARAALVRQVFRYFAQSFLDRAWLWHSPEATLRKRLRLVGAIHELEGNAPTVLFAPHFVGMDVGWLAMNYLTPEQRQYAGIYAPQTNLAMAD